MELWDWKQNQEAGLDPHKLTCGSGKMAHFECNQCTKSQPHKWSARVYSVVRGTGCPYCSSQKVCKCNSLATVRPDLAAEWCYPKNKRTPDDYTARAQEVVWWESAERGRWQASIASRSYSLHKPEVQTLHMMRLVAMLYWREVSDMLCTPVAQAYLQKRQAVADGQLAEASAGT